MSPVGYSSLAIDDPANLGFGVAPKPLQSRSGMVIGGGVVYPELNFTLPSMPINDDTMPHVRKHYLQIIDQALGITDRVCQQ